MLEIRTLEIKGFKKHSAYRSSFSTGLNLITGENYSGKSSIIQSILFAIYGPTTVPGGSAVIIKNGEERPLVTLTMAQNNGCSYVVERSVKQATLYENDSVVARSTSAVNDRIRELLGIDRKRFLLLKYVKPREANALLHLGGKELTITIEQLIGVNLVDNVLQLCKEKTSSVRTFLDTYTSSGTTDIDARSEQNRVTDLEQEVETLDLHIEHTEDELENHLKHVTLLAKEKEQAEKIHNLYVTNKTRQDRLNKELEEAVKRQEKANSAVAEFKHTASEMETQLETVNQRLEKNNVTENQRNTTEEKLNTIKRSLNEKKKQRRVWESELNNLTASDTGVDALEHQQTRLVEQLAEAGNKMTHCQSLLDNEVCPACNRPFTEIDPEAVGEQLTHAKHAHRQIKTQLDHVRQAIKTHNTLQHSVNNLAYEIEQDTQSVQELAQELDRLPAPLSTNEKQDLTREQANLKQQLTVVRQAQQTAKTSEEKVKWIQGELDQLNLGEDMDPGPVENELRNAEQQVASTRQTLERLTEQRYRTHTQIEVAMIRINDYERRKEAAQRAEKQLRDYNLLTKTLRTNREKFMTNVWDSLFAYASDFIHACTRGDLSQVALDPQGQFIFVENGVERPLDALSSAQQSVVGLGLKLALSSLLTSHFGCLLLDEPTADMQDEISAIAMTLFKEYSPQTICATHRQMDVSVADHHIHLGG